MKIYLNDQKTEVNSTSGWNLLNIQVQTIVTGNAGNRASDDEIRDELAESNWEKEHIEEFIEFINSELIEEMAF